MYAIRKLKIVQRPPAIFVCSLLTFLLVPLCLCFVEPFMSSEWSWFWNLRFEQRHCCFVWFLTVWLFTRPCSLCWTFIQVVPEITEPLITPLQFLVYSFSCFTKTGHCRILLWWLIFLLETIKSWKCFGVKILSFPKSNSSK